MAFQRLLVLIMLLACVSANYTKVLWNHRCDPGSEIFACTVPHFLYKPGRNHSTLEAPDTVHKVRLAYPMEKKILDDNEILAYDQVLHATLHRPRAIQITSCSLTTVEFPLDLEYADFADNSIKSVVVSNNVTSEYALQYLDLSGNRLESISNLSLLVNLKTLNLKNNWLESADLSVVLHMVKLSVLDLSICELEELSFASLPNTLEWLLLSKNSLSSLDLADVQLPALQVLDLQYNSLEELDTNALFAAARNLKVVLVGYNDFPREKAKSIAHTLREADITHDSINPAESRQNEWDEHYRSSQKQELLEHIINGMLVLVNVCVMSWGGMRLYEVFNKRNATPQ
ncbi:uncharacterized protein LOC128720964 [Anopheles nili]|uniref:uncharacterized protein LOC128720964 n=1 Tax=Anopheles nili TaxID=185578 RepID=UPI00237BA244|nr:uncharacterized protein LOC128720964 [Anopheles nili]